MSSRKIKTYKSILHTIDKCKGISGKVSDLIEASPVQKKAIAKSLKMKYVTFWRKVSTNKLTMDEMEAIVHFLIKAEESKN